MRSNHSSIILALLSLTVSIAMLAVEPSLALRPTAVADGAGVEEGAGVVGRGLVVGAEGAVLGGAEGPGVTARGGVEPTGRAGAGAKIGRSRMPSSRPVKTGIEA